MNSPAQDGNKLFKFRMALLCQDFIDSIAF